MSKQEQRMLAEAFTNIQKGLAKDAQRAMDKLWSVQISMPFSLQDALSGLTVGDLAELRKTLGLKNASQLKKQDLINRLVDFIPEALPGFLRRQDKTRWTLLQKLADQDGVVTTIDLDHFGYLNRCGIVYPGTLNGDKVFVMPQDIVQTIKKLDKTLYQGEIQRNTEWILLTQGLLYYYGMLDLRQLTDKIRYYTGQQVELTEYMAVIDEAIEFYGETEHESSGYKHTRVENPKAIKREQQLRSDLEYRTFTKAELLKAGKPDFVERNAAYKQLLQFILEQYKIDRIDAEFIVDDVTFAIQNDYKVDQILQLLQEELEMDNELIVKAFADKVIRLMNAMPRWVLKGYSPDGLSDEISKPPVVVHPIAQADVFNFATKKKIGRNDPCPCGSGKKYKKCCGR